MGSKNILQPEAIDRTIAALKKFRNAYKDIANVNVIALATAAARVAKNQKEFLRRAKEEAKVDIKVIPGTMEAHYDYLGVINTLPVTNCVIMDTGGASTELILVQNRKCIELVSLPIGAVNLTERFLTPEKISATELFTMMTAVDELYNRIWWLRQGMNLPLVALGGSNRTLAKIQRRKEHFLNFEDIHGFRMQEAQINDVFTDVISSNLEERKAIAGLAKDRADIIVGGLIPVVTMMRFLDSDRITFSQNGLREGVLYERLNERTTN